MKSRWLVVLAVCAAVLLAGQPMAFASHLKITNAMISEVNTETKVAKIQFNVSWDNSWKDDVNCDGVWVFAKFQKPQAQWQHVNLAAASPKPFDFTDQAPAKFSKGDGADVGMYVPEEQKGIFLFRAKAKGTSISNKVELIWNYTKDGVKDDEVMKTQVKVMGLEMVYVPQDKHYIGDPKGPDGPDNCLYTFPNNGAYLINSEDPINVDKVEGALYCDQDNPRSREDVPFIIPQDFPKGHKAFWIMKYELTSQQFCDFLNT